MAGPYKELREELDRMRVAYNVGLARDVEPITREAVRQGIAMLAVVGETERLLRETFDKLDPANERDAWFITRITKIREAAVGQEA